MPPRGPPDPSRPFGRASLPLPALRVGISTPPGPLGGTIDIFRPSNWASQLLSPLLEGSGGTEKDLSWRGLEILQAGLLTPPDPSQHYGTASRPLLDLQQGLPTPPSPLGGTSNLSRPSVKDSRPFPSLPTTPGPPGRPPNPPGPPGGLPTLPALPSPPGTPGETPDFSWPSERTSQPFLSL